MECNYFYAEASHNAGNIGNNTVSYKRYKHYVPLNYKRRTVGSQLFYSFEAYLKVYVNLNVNKPMKIG